MNKPFVEINADDFMMAPFDVEPPAEFKAPFNEETGQGFPNCCEYHANILNELNEWFTRFPNCCNKHRAFIGKWWFDKNRYVNLPQKISIQHAYTTFHIGQIEIDDWYKDVTDYIEYNIKSFGHPGIGADRYLKQLKHFIEKNADDLPKNKKVQLLDYLSTYYNPPQKASVSISTLYDIYQKWLNLFPFELSFFKDAKQLFERQILFIDGDVQYNKYLDLAKAKPLTPSKLIEFLIDTTKQLLQKIDTAQLFDAGIIKDTDKHLFELINETHRVKQSLLFNEYSKSEIKYATILKSWLTNEKAYFKEIAPFLKSKKQIEEVSPVKHYNLSSKLNKYRFNVLPKVKELNEVQLTKFIELMGTNDTPYQIAMFDFLDLIKHLQSQYCKTKEKLFNTLAEILNTNARTVKGNVLVLNEFSKENKERYTSHLYVKQVEKDYNNLLDKPKR